MHTHYISFFVIYLKHWNGVNIILAIEIQEIIRKLVIEVCLWLIFFTFIIKLYLWSNSFKLQEIGAYGGHKQ
jgi:hypothetical protein